MPGFEPDLFEQGRAPLAPRPHTEPGVCPEHLVDRRAHGQTPVEGTLRVLKHHLNLLSPAAQFSTAGLRGHRAAGEGDGAAIRSFEPDDDAGERRLSRPGFADHRETGAGLDRQ